MNGAKQLSFCGAVARALLIGVDKTCDGAVLSESKRTSPTRVGIWDFLFFIDNNQSLRRVNTRESCVYFWKRRTRQITSDKSVARPPMGDLWYNIRRFQLSVKREWSIGTYSLVLV